MHSVSAPNLTAREPAAVEWTEQFFANFTDTVVVSVYNDGIGFPGGNRLEIFHVKK
jgi:hypothetical protein